MFDIGFWELTVIGVVALLVIGPERLPGVARTMGLWAGKARRFVASVQADIGQELNRSEDLKKLLEEQTQIKEMHEIIEQSVDEVKKTVAVGNEQFQQTRHRVRSMEDALGETASASGTADAESTTENTGTSTRQPEQVQTPSTESVSV